MSEPDLDELRAELDAFAKPEKKAGRSAREERIIAGFEEIQRFVAKHGHPPLHGEDRDIFERIYAVRLDRLCALEGCRTLLQPLDHQGLLTEGAAPAGFEDSPDVDELAAELEEAAGASDITELRHVRTSADKRAAEEIANREPCPNFEKFKPLFGGVQRDLDNGARTTRPFVRDAGFLKADITEGQFFILGGQIAYVAEVGEIFKAPNGEYDARLRVIYSNGTQSNLLRRSLQRALYKDEAGRRITESSAGPLFADTAAEDDIESGTVYVLRSLSDNPEIASRCDLIHKIGVTGGKVETRIANAALDATYLLADVEIVATYKLFNINRVRFENIIHRVFASAQLDLTINDRFGNPVKPREWFLVPLPIIDEVVTRIRDGSIVRFTYDPQIAALREITAA
jgi:hypothetical protein